MYNADSSISFECEECKRIMFTYGKDNPVEHEKNFINNKYKTKSYYKCQHCGIKHSLLFTDPKTRGYELLPLEDNQRYVKCLKCQARIHADEIRYIDNNSAIICPDCGAKHSIILEGPINTIKLIRVIEE